jgi:hypothetical protein
MGGHAKAGITNLHNYSFSAAIAKPQINASDMAAFT